MDSSGSSSKKQQVDEVRDIISNPPMSLLWISALLNRGVKELSIESNRNLEISTHSLCKIP
ncbi:unnamed protein product, partial [Sphenostylis stenocarpa]